jgi:hypothetical protein
VPKGTLTVPRTSHRPLPLVRTYFRLAAVSPRCISTIGATSTASSNSVASPVNPAGNWLRRADLNGRPRGYEPRELPLLYPALAEAIPFLAALRRFASFLTRFNFQVKRHSGFYFHFHGAATRAEDAEDIVDVQIGGGRARI